MKYTKKSNQRKRRQRPRTKTVYRRKKLTYSGNSTRKVTKFYTGNNIVPDKAYLKLRYTDTVSFSTTTGLAGFYVFSGNSLHDPDVSGVGSQPYGFDQWKTFYQKYRVIGSKAKVTITPSGSTSTENCVQCTLIPSLQATNIATSVGSVFDLVDVQYAKTGIVNADSTRRVSNYIQTGKLWGYDKYQIKSNQEFEASTVANPTKQWYWHIYLYGLDLQACNAYVNIEIEYYVEMFQMITQPAS